MAALTELTTTADGRWLYPEATPNFNFGGFHMAVLADGTVPTRGVGNAYAPFVSQVPLADQAFPAPRPGELTPSPFFVWSHPFVFRNSDEPDAGYLLFESQQYTTAALFKPGYTWREAGDTGADRMPTYKAQPEFRLFLAQGHDLGFEESIVLFITDPFTGTTPPIAAAAKDAARVALTKVKIGDDEFAVTSLTDPRQTETTYEGSMYTVAGKSIWIPYGGNTTYNIGTARGVPTNFTVGAANMGRRLYVIRHRIGDERGGTHHQPRTQEMINRWRRVVAAAITQVRAGIAPPILELSFGGEAVVGDIIPLPPDPIPIPQPPDPPKPIPAPMLPPTPTPGPVATGGAPSFHALMAGSWRNITGYVLMAQWQHGSRERTQTGSLKQPAKGVLTLDNRNGVWSIYNPAANFTPIAGVPVEVWSGVSRNDGDILFKGWSGGVQMTTPRGQQDVALMALQGPLTRLSTIRGEVFERFTGRIRIDDAFREIMLSAGLALADMRIFTASTDVYGTRLSRSSQFGAGRNYANLQDGLKLLALLEGGRIYDDRRGLMTFESINGPRRMQATDAVAIAAEDILDAESGNSDEGIINYVTGQFSQARAEGVEPIPLIAPNNQRGTAFTLRIYIGAGQTHQTVWRLDASGSADWIQQLIPMATPADYETYYAATGTAPADWAANITITTTSDGQAVTLRIVNNDAARPVGVLLKQMRGLVFGVRNQGRFAPATNAASIRQYGRRPMIFPGETIAVPGRVEGRAADIVARHNGMDARGLNPEPIKTMRLTMRNPARVVWDISQLVTVSWRTADAEYLRGYPFWIESSEHRLDIQGNHDIMLELYDAVPDRV